MAFTVLAFVLFTASTTFAQVNRTIGTLPPGGAVTITFAATINSNTFPLNTFSVTNQGSVSGTLDNFEVQVVSTPEPVTVALGVFGGAFALRQLWRSSRRKWILAVGRPP